MVKNCKLSVTIDHVELLIFVHGSMDHDVDKNLVTVAPDRNGQNNVELKPNASFVEYSHNQLK